MDDNELKLYLNENTNKIMSDTGAEAVITIALRKKITKIGRASCRERV